MGVLAFFYFGSKTKNKDFSKGIMVINTDRQEYLVGETVKILMTVVDKTGKVNCDARLKLTINGVEAKNTAKSPTCIDSITQNPDYFFNFVPEKEGKYEVKLTNLDTKISILNTFDVVEERNIDISREAAMRIAPSKKDRYPMKLIVTAKNDFSGEISDLIPSSFTIPWQGQAKVEENKISWQVNLKAGETKELIYEYSAPKTVFALYTFGENNEWQVISLN